MPITVAPIVLPAQEEKVFDDARVPMLMVRWPNGNGPAVAQATVLVSDAQTANGVTTWTDPTADEKKAAIALGKKLEGIMFEQDLFAAAAEATAAGDTRLAQGLSLITAWIIDRAKSKGIIG